MLRYVHSVLADIVLVAQEQASTSGFNWAQVAASALGAGIGAAAALTGVSITQRGERAKAHADRIWKERADVYVSIYRWAFGWSIKYFGNQRRASEIDVEDYPDRYTKLMMYGSVKVVEAFDDAVMLRDQAKGRDDVTPEEKTEIFRAMRSLMREIQHETRGNPERKPNTRLRSRVWWLTRWLPWRR